MNREFARWLVLVLLLTAAAAVAPARAHNGSVAVAYPVQGITVDGDLSDWPDTCQTYPIERAEYGSAVVDSLDLRAWFRVGYDAGSLFLAVEAQDEAVVVDTTDEWNTQDGCEVFVDLAHRLTGSPCVQHVVYGTTRDVYLGDGAEAEVESAELAIQRTTTGHRYEWRIDVSKLTSEAPELRAGMVLGMDVALTDRDAEGAFSWVAWGRGVGKLGAPARRGDLILAAAPEEVPALWGRVRWQGDGAGIPPRRVRIELENEPESFWVQLDTDTDGVYRVSLPAGRYNLQAVDVRVPVKRSPQRRFTVHAGREKQIKTLDVKPSRKRGALVDQLFAGLGPQDPGAAVLVARDGRVLYRNGYGLANVELGVAITPETKFRLASVSTQFTAVAVMQLAERGLVDIDAPLSRYLPDYPQGDRITIRQLIAHTAGVHNFLSMSEFWEVSALRRDLPGLIAIFRDQPLDFEPGDRCSYSNSGFALLAYLVEVVAEQPFAEYVEEHIFAPLGMDDTGSVDQSAILPGRASGYLLSGDGLVHPNYLDFSLATGAAGIYSTVNDLFRWDESLYAAEPLSAATLQQMFTQQELNDGSQTTYGLGWRVGRQNGLLEIAETGLLNGFTSRFSRFPDQHFLVVVLCNNPRLYPGTLAAQIAEIYLSDEMDWGVAQAADSP